MAVGHGKGSWAIESVGGKWHAVVKDHVSEKKTMVHNKKNDEVMTAITFRVKPLLIRCNF